jgi:hypothetical protein
MKPLFFMVQGTDFGRSNKWAKGWVNPVNAALQSHLQKIRDCHNNPCTTIRTGPN